MGFQSEWRPVGSGEQGLGVVAHPAWISPSIRDDPGSAINMSPALASGSFTASHKGHTMFEVVKAKTFFSLAAEI